MPAVSRARRAPRVGSSAKSFRRWRGAIWSQWDWRAFQAGRVVRRSVMGSSFGFAGAISRAQTDVFQLRGAWLENPRHNWEHISHEKYHFGGLGFYSGG